MLINITYGVIDVPFNTFSSYELERKATSTNYLTKPPRVIVCWNAYMFIYIFMHDEL